MLEIMNASRTVAPCTVHLLPSKIFAKLVRENDFRAQILLFRPVIPFNTDYLAFQTNSNDLVTLKWANPITVCRHIHRHSWPHHAHHCTYFSVSYFCCLSFAFHILSHLLTPAWLLFLVSVTRCVFY